jgi:hypothetical protein
MPFPEILAAHKLHDPCLLAACPAGAGDAQWTHCNAVTISHATIGTLTADSTPIPGISPGRAYAIITTTAAPSHPAKQLFCMTQINSEASMVPAASEGNFYLFKNVFYDSYLAVVDGKLAASPSSGFLAGASSNQAAAALIYTNNSFLNQYNGRLVGVVADGQGMVEDDGSGSVTFAASQALQITPVTGVGDDRWHDAALVHF